MELKLSLELPEDRSHVRLTRILVRAMLEHLRVQDSEIDDLELVVGELCANVVRHSRSRDGRFLVGLECIADQFVVSVRDKGKGFGQKELPEAGTPREDFDGSLRIGGFGLQIVRQLSDKLDLARARGDGAVVTVRKSLHHKAGSATDWA